MTGRPEVRYLPRECPFVKRAVWAILTKHADEQWSIVNCLDKEASCFQQNCALTTDGGEWPFEGARIVDRQDV